MKIIMIFIPDKAPYHMVTLSAATIPVLERKVRENLARKVRRNHRKVKGG